MKKIIIGISFILFNLFTLNAQDFISDALFNEGFENIQVKATGSNYYLSYENNRYRFEADALYQVLNAIASSLMVQEKVHILIKNRNIPYSAVHTSKSSLEKLFKGELSYQEWKSESTFTMCRYP